MLDWVPSAPYTAEQLLEVADGFYLMTPFHRVALVNRIIDGIRKLLG